MRGPKKVIHFHVIIKQKCNEYGTYIVTFKKDYTDNSGMSASLLYTWTKFTWCEVKNMKDDMNKGHFPQYNPSSFQTSMPTCYNENPFSFVNRSVFQHEPKSKLMSRDNVSSLHAFSMTSLLRRENQLSKFICTCLPCYFARGMIWLKKNRRI